MSGIGPGTKLGILMVWFSVIIGLFTSKGEKDRAVEEVKQLAKSNEINFLQPQMRVNLLRYIENDDKDSMVYMQKKIGAMKKEQKILDSVKVQMKDLQKLVDKKDYGNAVNLIINIKAELKKENFEVRDPTSLIKDLEIKRAELYSKAERSEQ